MDSTKDTAPPARPSTRELRALALYRERGEEIREIGPDLFEVPSCSGSGVYQVDYEAETCSCLDHEHRPGQPCKHILAVGIIYAKTHRCIGLAGDPFAAAGRSGECAACYEGWVYLGELAENPETGEEAEIVHRVPCRRCQRS